MNNSYRKLQGFTLLELLIGMALLGIILSVLVSLFGQSAQTSTQSGVRAELQQEVLNSQQLVVSRLKQAWYVYPPTTAAFSLSTTLLTKNPITRNQSWNIRTDPIVVMILPPTPFSTPAVTNYTVYAYLAVLRSDWTSGITKNSVNDPGPDSVNDDSSWVLAEFKANLPSSFNPPSYSTGTAPTGIPALSFSNLSPQLLTDYIAPARVGTTDIYRMFSYGTDPSSGVVQSVNFNIATGRKVGSQALRLPSATGQYQLSVYPANLGK